MTLGMLLSELNRREVEVWIEGDALRVRAPKGALQGPLREALAQHKAELMDLLRDRRQIKRDEIPLVPASRDAPAPMSYGQQSLWFLDQIDGGTSAYNVPMVFWIEGPFDPEICARSLREIVQRHEILRTRLLEKDGAPVQIVDAEARVDFRVVEEREIPGDAPGKAVELIRREGERPFDLARGPLLRVVMVRCEDGRQLFLLCLHHIVIDQSTRSIFVGELATLYGAFARGEPSPLPPLALQYGDFAHWQRRMLAGPARERLVGYWRSKLAGAPPLLELPVGRPRPRVPTYGGGEVRFEVGPALTERLKALSQAASATSFMGMLSAFFVFLNRLTGRDDLVVGTNAINRTRPELTPLIGFFVDNLVMRADLRGEPSFAAVLERVRVVVLEAFAHQDLPFELLVEELAPERSRAYNPLFQVSFAWSRAEPTPSGMSGLTITPVEIEVTSARFDLTLFVVEHGDRLAVSLVFRRDLFEQSTIEHLAGCFQTLLLSLLTEPGRPVGDLPLLPEADLDRVLLRWNATRTSLPGGRCLHALFEEQARRAPGEAAVHAGGEVLTYGELDGRSDLLAAHLQALGVAPGVVVAIFLEVSPLLIVSLLAVLKAGGAFLAIDPREPSERLAQICDDAEPPLLITDDALARRLPTLRSALVSWDDRAAPEGTREAAKAILRRDVGPEDRAYLIYTSGSTGRPKGTEICHQSIVNYLCWCVGAYGVRDGVGAPVLGSVSFDGTLTSLFAPLVAGRALFLLPPGREIELLASSAYPARGFSFIKMTPSHLRAFTSMGKASEVLARTRALVLGGEALHGGDLTAWRGRGAEVRIFNEYGPTEITVACSAHEVPAGAPLPERIPIGRPIANAEIFLLDRRGQPVPIGVPGELHVGGAGLARGYLNDPTATRARFVPNPLHRSSADGAGSARLYRTGDLARYLPDGALEFLGRLDDQLKIRGHRVEPGEIEAALGRHPGIGQSTVVLDATSRHAPRLIAYLQPIASGPAREGLDARALREHLRALIPEAMIPSVFVLVDALPLTPSGKVDRRSLPAPDPPPREGAAERRGPRPREGEIAAIFGDLLGLSEVEPGATFFDLGGHSLLAVTLLARIQARFGVDIPLNEVFERATVEGLARWIDEHAPGAAGPEEPLPECVVCLKSSGSKPPLFCVPPSVATPAIFLPMVRHLGADQPVFSFQAQGLVDDRPPQATVEEAALTYLTAMREVQPEGPYRLVGWSFGGLVACEMARQLEAMGEEIALLALIDGMAVDQATAAEEGRSLRELVFGSAQLVTALAEISVPQSYEELRLIGQWIGLNLPASPRDVFRRDAVGERSYLRRHVDDVRRAFRVAFASYLAGRRYVLAPYGGRAVLFRTALGAGERGDALARRAREFARGGLELYPVPGNHMTVVMEEQHARVLARGLQECLDRALPAARAGELEIRNERSVSQEDR